MAINIENYETFLKTIMEIIDRKFENQKEYIFCKRGCSKCCQTITVPFTTLEFEYIMEGFKTLADDKKEIIRNNIKSLKENSDKKVCPFLINDECSLYKYRGLICRTFGLMTISGDGEYTIPFCVNDGLNYSNVYDKNTKKISDTMYEQGDFEVEPKFFPFNRTLICNLNLAKELELDWGESKELREWLYSLPSETD